jgi:general stress protein YciG
MANEKQSGGTDELSKQPGGSGNFANDRERASEAGKKGGQHSHGGGTGQANQSGSGRSQQGAVQSDDDDESNESGKSSGSTKDRR